MIGKRISHYRILEELDQGGMGVIFKAEDIHLGRPAALKFLPAAMCDDEEVKQRFIHEAKAASALDHPNICTIYEIGETDEGHLFIAMAYYEGETLHKKISREPLSVNLALDYVRQIAAGLGKSHERDIIHRDIKPANIFVTSDGQVKILDFGLAKMIGEGITFSGMAQGTPAYMAPERIRNEKANPRTDLWSLGVLLHEALAGERPFSGRSIAEIIRSVHEDEPVALHTLHSEVTPGLSTIVRKLLRKNPMKRYASCEDLLWDLEDLEIDGVNHTAAQRSSGALRPLTPFRRPPRRVAWIKRKKIWAVIALTLAMLLAASLWQWQNADLIPSTATDAGSIKTSSPAALRHYKLGMKHHLKLEEQAAAEAFQKAVKLDPEFGMAWAKLTAIALNLHQQQKALEYSGKALEFSEQLDPQERNYIEGFHYIMDIRTWDKALTAFQRAVEADPNHQAARQNLALVYGALEHYEQSIEQSEILERLETSIQGSYASQAESYVAIGKPDKAKALLQRKVDKEPNNFVVRCALGYYHLRNNKLDDALATFLFAEEIKPGHRNNFQGLCSTLLLQQQWDEAEHLCQESQQLDDPALSMAATRCQILIALYHGKSAEALKITEELITPQARASARLWAAQIHLHRGEARAAFEQAHSAHQESQGRPLASQALFYAGQAEIARQRFDAAIEIAMELQTMGTAILNPLMLRQSLHLKGLIALNQGRSAEAIATLEKAVESLPARGVRSDFHEPDHVLLWASLADAYLKVNNADQAEPYLKLIISSTEERVHYPVHYARSLYKLGKIYQQRGDDPLSRQAFDRFLDLWQGGDLALDWISSLQDDR